MLIALRGTRLYKRLHQEGRLVGDASGNNMDISLNFVPKMDTSILIGGYRAILDYISS